MNETALARLFAEERVNGAVRWFSLPGGAMLCEPGDPAEELYFLKAGKLGAFHREEGQEQQFLGVIRPGEPAGEMALVAGTPHSAAVVALRDSEIFALSRDEFFAAVERRPEVMTELARLMILRARQTAASSVGEPSVFGFIAVSGGPPVRPLVGQLGAMLESMGHTVAVAGAEAVQAPTEWFSRVEANHDFVLYAAEAGDTAWKTIVGRQVDRLFRVGRGGQRPPASVMTYASEPLQAQALIDLLLVHPPGTTPKGCDPWLDVMGGAARIFHIRDGDREDLARLARGIAGQSVGLVLAGGGARAYAHVGAIRAMRERGVPIDFVGGVSMGAIIAAGIALGWDDAELDWRIRKAFVESAPLDDIALPMIAMSRGMKVKERLEEHFGDAQIADLMLPFFCISSNLTTGAYHLHRRGLLQKALRASISLPGILPPVIDDGDVLVDGAVVKNFPADVMRAFQRGPVVGVDVSRGRSITADDVKTPPSLWRWLVSGDWRKGPPIVGLLMRAGTISTSREMAASREATDVLILPKLDRIDLRDWRAYEPAVQAGYQAALQVLDGLDRPVTEMRRRGRRASAPITVARE